MRARRARVRFFFRGEGELFHRRAPDDGILSDLSEAARQVHARERGERSEAPGVGSPLRSASRASGENGPA